MAKYTPIFKKKYPDGFINAPPKETPLTAEIFNNYDDALIAIESFLSELQETAEDSNENTGTNIDLENLIVTNSISLGRKADTAIGEKSTAEGTDVTASGTDSHAEGHDTKSSGNQSHTEGYKTIASKDCAHAEGYETKAEGFYAHSEGYGTTSSAYVSHAEGKATTASGDCSHAEGNETTAGEIYAHAEGDNTAASGDTSHAEGSYTTASGRYSHAEGRGTIASKESSHAEGWYTIASGEYSHVQGKYNIEDTENKYAHIVGNGSYGKPSNAHTLDWSGNAWFAGNIYIGGAGQGDENAKKLVTEQYVLEQIAELKATIEELNNKLNSLSSTASE